MIPSSIPAQPDQMNPSLDASMTSMQPMPAPDQKKNVMIVALVGVVIVLVGVILFMAPNLSKPSQSGQNTLGPSASAQPVTTNGESGGNPAATPTTVSSVDPAKRLLFTNGVDKLNPLAKLDAWLYTPATGTTEKLDLGSIGYAFKLPDTQLVFYSKSSGSTSNNGKVFVQNLSTNQTKEIDSFKHPDPEAITNVYIANIAQIAPDGSKFVAQVDYFKKCPGAPAAIEGGPCEPDHVQGYDNGYYLVDVATGKAQKLPDDSLLVAGWDMARSELFITTANNELKSYNWLSGVANVEFKDKSFGFGAYPIMGTPWIVLFTANTDSASSAPGDSEVALYNLQTKEKNVLQKGVWAEWQPFASISPDKSVVLYQKTPRPGDGMIKQIYSYNLQTKKTFEFKPAGVSLPVQGVWLDNDHFVTWADPTPDRVGGSDLVSLNVKTGQLEYLTKNKEVTSFGLY